MILLTLAEQGLSTLCDVHQKDTLRPLVVTLESILWLSCLRRIIGLTADKTTEESSDNRLCDDDLVVS